MSVGAIEPVGMTNASTTNARKTNASTKATRIDSIVSLTLVSVSLFGAGSVMVWIVMEVQKPGQGTDKGGNRMTAKFASPPVHSSTPCFADEFRLRSFHSMRRYTPK